MLDRIRKPSGDARVSDLDRQRAVAHVEQLASEGIIRGEEELELRRRRIRLAINQRELDVALDGLQAGERKLDGGDLRASDADRADAVRRLDAHGAMGHLTEDELSARVALVQASKTSDEIAKVFIDLPELATSSQPAERRISTQDRDEAIDFLEQARREGRLDAVEHAAAKEQVRAARTRGEINAAFRGLSSPTRAAVTKAMSSATKQTAGLTSHVVVEGGRRVRKAFLRGLFAMAALMIGVILLIAGVGLAAVVCFVGAVLLFVSAASSLLTSQAST